MQMIPRLSKASPNLARGLSVMAMAVSLACKPAAAQDDASDPAKLGIELNKLEQTDAACRSYMVLSNSTETSLEKLSLDLVVFDTDGVIDRRLAVELGPLDAGRTQVKVFDMAGLECGRVARILLNDVLSCSPDRINDTATCDEALLLSARGDVAFIR